MNRLITLLTLLFIVGMGYAQCPDPTADAVQYVCPGSNSQLDDLNVALGGTAVWYDDANKTNVLPGTTTITDGETYYVANDEAGCESDAVPVTVYEQSVEFVVSPDSCIDLGKNVFFIEEDDLNNPVEIEVLNHDGDPHEQPIIWTPVASNEFEFYWNLGGYWDSLPETASQGPQIPGQLVFNHIRKTLDPFELLELDLNITGDSCSNSQESITIIAGGLEYKEICYGTTSTLQDIFDYYDTLLGGVFDFYDVDQGGSLLPLTTVVEPGDTYYIDFDVAGCDVRIPVVIDYAVEAPKGAEEFFYCSEDAWSLIGVTDSETLADIRVDGDNLTWYDNTMSPISNIGSVVLEDGDVYYVTDTVNGCESEPLKIEITETDCGCLDEEIKFYNIPMGQHNTCNMGFIANPAPITVGTTNGMGPADNAVYTTPGNDPSLALANIELPRTSPFAEATTGESFRLNTNKEYQTVITSARKRFVAGEVVAFDFAMVMQNPNHSFEQMPFFQINVYDNQNNIIQTRCIVSDEEDCIFQQATIPWDNGNMDPKVLYSDWSSVKLDTRSIQGEAGMIEFIVAFCTPTQHFGYAYIDNIFVGDDANTNPEATASFGYIEIETVENGSLVYDEECSYMDMNRGEMCEAILPALNPDFPIEICGKLDFPVNALQCFSPDLKHINLNVLKGGTVMGTVSNAVTTPTGFCFELEESDISGPLYGHFSLEADARFRMNDGSPNAYDYEVLAMNSGFKICPVAACVEDMKICIPADTSPFQHNFDLTDNEEDALSNYDIADHDKYEFSYYTDLEDARDAINPITNPSAFTATGTHTIYVRLDYDWNEIGLTKEEDCFDIISFEVIVSSAPELPDDPIELEVCEVEGDNGGYFDFDDEDLFDAILENITVDKEDHELVFYETQNGADNEDSSEEIDIDDEYFVATGSDSVWVRIISPGDCYAVLEIELTVNPLPELTNTNITILACEDGSGNGEGVFNLPDQIDAAITDLTNGYSITYYNDLNDAEQGDQQDAIANPGNYTGEDDEVIYIRVEDPNIGCAIVTEATLEVVDAPTVPPLTPLELCDEGNGQAEFDLDSLIPYIQDGNSTLDVDFYSSQQDADNQNAPLPSLYTSGNTTIYVRVGAPGLDCPAVVTMDLIVNENPIVPTTPIELALCENEDGSDVEFDLSGTMLSDAVLEDVAGNKNDYEIEFYTSQAAAENATTNDQIDETELYPVPGTTQVWVRIINTSQTTECFSVVSVTLTVNPLPTINSPVVLQACDLGSGNGISEFDLNEATIFMVGLGSNYTVTYYLSTSDAEQATGAININYTNTIAYNDTVYARIEDNDTACYIVEPIQLEVLDAPIAQDAELIYCDPNNDGEGIFYLPDADADITSDSNAVISYHRTQADADNDANPLPDTVTNNMINNQQYVYARVEVAGVGCHTVVRIKLIIEETPELVTPTEIFIGCDDDGTGVHVFDLEEIVEEEVTILLNDPTDYDITYFETDSNGDKAAQIPSPSAYPSSGGIVVVVVTNPLTGCSTEVEIELFVAPLPEVHHPAPLELCDINNPGDETEEFYLDEATEEITGGDQSLTVTYHLTQADADTGDNLLAIPYENTENNQTIYIRVENEWGCVVTEGITLTLVVNPLPAPVTPEPYEVCDIDNEGFAYFDLESLEEEIINNEPDVSISFHETHTDAEAATNPLPSPYQNIVVDEQVIYARVTNDDTGCFTIIEIILRAIPSPKVPVELDDLYFCTPDMDEGVRVNLTVYETIIYGFQNRDELDLTYHLTEDAAHAGTGAIADPTDFLLNPPTPRTIWVRLGYKDDGCYNVVPFVLHLVEGPQINDPTALSMCTPLGEENTETAVFDLLDKREEIIGNQTGLGLRFYEEEEDALLGNNNHISNPSAYTNTENPQIIYVRVVDSQENEEAEGCVAFTTLTLRVEANPEPVTPDPIEICHLSGSDEATIVDLTIRDLQILNHEDWELEYYEKYRDAVAGDPFSPYKINAPETYEILPEDSPKIIYVRVINPESGCFAIVELEIILSGLPNMALPEDIEPLVVCTTEGKDWAEFDLTTKIPEIFGNQDLEGLDIFFYEEEEEAIAGENPIVDPEAYYNTNNPQTIYVGIGNPEIDDCYYGGITWFEIEVREGAVAHSPADAYKVCGMDDGSGGVAEFYLAHPDLIDEILGLQNPADFYVDFYENEEDAEEGDINLALGDYYTNTSNPQTIYVRVTNAATECYAIAEVELEVVVLEDLILQDIYSLCTDEFGNIIEDEEGNIIYPIIDTGLDADDFEFTWYYEGEVILTQVGPNLEVHEIGTYRVEIVSLSQGCVLIKDIEVVESSMPFNAGADVVSPAFSGTYDIQAWAEGFGDYWFSLNGGVPQEEGLFTNVGPGTHVITIEDLNGCGSMDVIVNVVDYPKFFTPNDDGYNDTWNIPGMADLDPSAEIYIFDRHGKLLKQLNPSGLGWDGTFNGKPLPSTDYWFVVKYKEEGVAKEFKGHFSLKR